MEVETEWEDDPDIPTIVDDETEWYAKEDGSLDDGVELVSHPRTLESWLEPRALRAVQEARDQGAKSNSRGNCGMHVHVSGETVTRMMVAKLDLLLMSDHDETERYAERSLGYYCEPPLDKKAALYKATDRCACSRYSAVNTSNGKTVEIRIFRSTTRVDVIRRRLATLELMLEYCRECSVLAATWEGFHGWLATGAARRHVDRKILKDVRKRQGVLVASRKVTA